jgi:glycosyltransferase involved in cell wall biosynthesis
MLLDLNRRVERTRSGVLEREEFDVCIFTTGSTITLVPKVRARHYIYRCNDLLAKLPGVPRSLVAFETALLRGHPIAAACPVNDELAAGLRARNPGLRVEVVPNGIDRALVARATPDPALAATRDRNVIYAGAFTEWVDVELLLGTAALLPERDFHLFGAWFIPRPAHLPPNVVVHGAVAHDRVPGLLKAATVGVIPYGRQNASRMVERPHKYYEYLEAGLGVAASRHAGSGLAPYAAVGNTPPALVEAIRCAPSLRAQHAAALEAELGALDWGDIARAILAVLPDDAGHREAAQ